MEHLGYIRTGGEERVEATTENTHVYKHLGNLAVYNHVFVRTEDDGAVYVWSHQKGHAALEKLALDKVATAHLNLREVHPIDLEHYETQALKDLQSTDSVPEGWA